MAHCYDRTETRPTETFPPRKAPIAPLNADVGAKGSAATHFASDPLAGPEGTGGPAKCVRPFQIGCSCCRFLPTALGARPVSNRASKQRVATALRAFRFDAPMLEPGAVRSASCSNRTAQVAKTCELGLRFLARKHRM